MSWLSITLSVLYYIFLPLTTLLNFLLVLLAPLTHLTFYTAHGFFLPFSFLGKFEVWLALNILLVTNDLIDSFAEPLHFLWSRRAHRPHGWLPPPLLIHYVDNAL